MKPEAARVTLYAVPHSLYSGKVRSYLRFKGIPFDEVTSTVAVYATVIVPRTGVHYIPVVRTADGKYVQDSTVIIDALESRYPDFPIYPETPRQRLAALMIELWADEWLLLPAMHYRWSFIDQQADDIYEHFALVFGLKLPRAVRRVLGYGLARPFAHSLPLLGVTPRTIPEVERSYLQVLDLLDAHFAEHPFLFGNRPSIGDFGLMGPLYAHLWRDPYPKALMQRRAPRVFDWVKRMNTVPTERGDFLPDDRIPDTLTPLLQLLSKEFAPVLADTVKRVKKMVPRRNGKEMPRFLGWHTFQLGEVSDKRMVSTYTQWMFQRVLDHYASLQGAARSSVDEWLNEVGGAEMVRLEPARLRRVRNRLFAA